MLQQQTNFVQNQIPAGWTYLHVNWNAQALTLSVLIIAYSSAKQVESSIEKFNRRKLVFTTNLGKRKILDI